MKRKLSKIALVTALFACNVLTAQAASVTVNNASFEADVLVDGGFNFSITGWNLTGTDGTFNPISGTHFTLGAPDGFNTAFSNGGTISQTLTETINSGYVYSLLVDVGKRLEQGVAFPVYEVALLAGTNVLASESILTPNAGAFLTSSLSYTADNTFAGQALTIRLSSKGVQTNFDNVRLDATAVESVPEAETSAMMMLGLGIIGFMARRRKTA